MSPPRPGADQRRAAGGARPARPAGPVRRAVAAVLNDVVDPVVDAALDLALGSSCAGCRAPGRALCRACASALPATAAAAWPTPAPAGLVRPAACGDYAGVLRALVLAHKEHGRLALSRPLGRVLAVAVADCWGAAGTGRTVPPGPGTAVGPLLVVPVPSHPAVVRERGHDPVLRMARVAAAELRRRGLPARVALLVRVAQRPEDQAGLDAAARRRNLDGRFVARAGTGAGRPGSRPGPRSGVPPSEVVLVDDVVTTGATLREAQRALEAVGVVPVGAAAVAATRRRLVHLMRDPGAAESRHAAPDRIGQLPCVDPLH